MIRYALKCKDDHSFESWFQSAEAYEKLSSAGHVTCPTCGTSAVDKALMAPRVRPARKSSAVDPVPDAAPAPTSEAPQVPSVSGSYLTAPASAQEAALQESRQQVEANSDYVGKDFVKEARDMHLGDAPARAIHGEAKIEDAKALIEDGVPVVPLPFAPKRKTN